MKTFYERLAYAATYRRKSMAQVAEKAGVTRQALFYLEGGRDREMKAGGAARAAAFLRCDLNWLCTGEGGPFPLDAEEATDARVARITALVSERDTADQLLLWQFLTENRGESLQPFKSE